MSKLPTLKKNKPANSGMTRPQTGGGMQRPEDLQGHASVIMTAIQDWSTDRVSQVSALVSKGAKGKTSPAEKEALKQHFQAAGLPAVVAAVLAGTQQFLQVLDAPLKDAAARLKQAAKDSGTNTRRARRLRPALPPTAASGTVGAGPRETGPGAATVNVTDIFIPSGAGKNPTQMPTDPVLIPEVVTTDTADVAVSSHKWLWWVGGVAGLGLGVWGYMKWRQS